jgi:hypothetical protein
MNNAQLLMGQQKSKLPHGFWQQLGLHQSCENGVILENASIEDDGGLETFWSDTFTQDISLSQSLPASTTSIQQLATSMQMIHQNSNMYDSSISKLKGILNTVQICNEPEVEGFFTAKLNALIGEVQELVHEKFGHDSNLNGEYVSLSVPVDRRQKCKRIKSKSEPPPRAKRLYKGERTTVQLAVSSILT